MNGSKMIKKDELDWANSLSDEEQAEIEKGLKQADNNEFIEHVKVIKRFSKWHNSNILLNKSKK